MKTNHIWYQKYEQGVPHEIDLSSYSSLTHILENAMTEFSHRQAFHCLGKSITYKELDQLSNNFAAYLQQELQMNPGDKIALMMPNVLQYPVALFGALKAGLVIVNVNPLYTPRELEHQLQDSKAKVLLVLENFAHTVEQAHTPFLEKVIVTKMGDLLGTVKGSIVNLVVKFIKKMVPSYKLDKTVSFKELMKKGSSLTPIPVVLTHNSIAFLQYTGGTTGVSKGAILTHGNILSNLLQAKAWLTPTLQNNPDQEIIITPLPLYHIFSLTANCFIFSSIGGLNVLIPNPRDIPGFVKELKKWKFTAFTGLNTLFNGLLNHPDFKNLDFSKLKIVLGGGMAIQEAVAKRWKETTRVPIIEAYGLTETSPAATVNPLNISEFTGFVGLPLPSTEVSIRSDDFKELPTGELGEICIKGPQVMKGYYNQPEETAKVMQEGWFKTGDIGFMDPNGFIKIVDRKKDMIIVSGFNVYPNEVEDVVMQNEKVLECAVVGVKDEIKGENIKLFIVKKDPTLSTEEILTHCREKLTAYKVPKIVEFRNELPKSNVGKILRKALRD